MMGDSKCCGPRSASATKSDGPNCRWDEEWLDPPERWPGDECPLPEDRWLEPDECDEEWPPPRLPATA